MARTEVLAVAQDDPQQHGRDQEGHQVHTDAEAQEEGHEDEPSAVAALFPPQREPHGEGTEEHGHGVDLALDGGEPGGVAEEIAQGAHHGPEEGAARGVARPRKQQACAQEEQQHRQRGAEHGDEVAQRRHQRGVAEGEEHEAVGDELIERRSRRMAHLEAVARGDELAAVPPRNRAVHGEEVDEKGKQEDGIPYQFTTDLLKTSSHSSVTISDTRELSTEEKSREAA